MIISRHWYNAAEDQRLRELLPTHTHAQIADRLGDWATEHSVRKRCARLGLVRRHTVAWSPEIDAELTRLRKEGFAYSVIAQRLDVTRNAAIGRAQRLGLVAPPRSATDFRPKRGRGLNITQKVNRARDRSKVSAVKPAPIPELPLTAYFRGVTLLDLEPSQCRYPQGDGANILFCGQTTDGESSWCDQCKRIVFSGKAPIELSLAERYRRLRQGKRNYKQQQARAA